MIMTGINQLLPLFLLTMIGIFLGKKKLLSHQFRRELTEFCFMILFPASVITSFEGFVMDVDTLMNSGKLILVGGVWIAVPLLVALGTVRFFHLDKASENVLIFAAVYNNFGFAGLGMVNSLYGSTGLFYSNMLGLVYRMTNMPLGIWIMERGRREKCGSKFADIFKTPPVVAILVMIPVALLRIPLPQVIYDTADMFNDCLAPVGMVVTGLAISDFSLGELIKGKACYIISAVRLVLLPAVMAGIMLAMGLKGTAFTAPLLSMTMPVAANCALLAEKYQADSRLAAQCVLLSTLLSLLTIPVWVAIGEQLF